MSVTQTAHPERSASWRPRGPRVWWSPSTRRVPPGRLGQGACCGVHGGCTGQLGSALSSHRLLRSASDPPTRQASTLYTGTPYRTHEHLACFAHVAFLGAGQLRPVYCHGDHCMAIERLLIVTVWGGQREACSVRLSLAEPLGTFCS